MKSKKENIIKLFYNNPTKEWHFEELVKKSKMARSKVNKWLKYYLKKKIIRRIKKKGKMPYYISNYDSSEYKINKKIYALEKLHETGFLMHLNSLKRAKSVIIFGSMTRSDWYKESDIDLFIYGNTKELDIAKYEKELEREIQVFNCKTEKDLKKLGKGLIKNIIKGDLIKGNLNFIGVEINA